MKHQHAATHPATHSPKKAKTAVSKAAPRAAAQDTSGMSIDGRDEFIRQAAYSCYEARGRIGGHELDDWLRAEAEFERLQVEGRPDASSGAATH
jgi:hypothetical protein